MADQRIDGAFDQAIGKAKNGLGSVTGDAKMQIEGAAKEMGGQAKAAYGRIIDGLDGLADKAPPEVRDPAKRGLEFARNRPLLTTGLVVGAAVLLSRLGRR
jgi:uncharacterized protein YjbJ (UPF0337 family)